MCCAQRFQFGHPRRVAKCLSRQDGSRFQLQQLGHRLKVHIEGPRVAVRKQRCGPQRPNGIGHGHKAERGDHDFVSGSNAKGGQHQCETSGAGRTRDPTVSLGEFGDRFGEVFDPRPAGQYGGLQHVQYRLPFGFAQTGFGQWNGVAHRRSACKALRRTRSIKSRMGTSPCSGSERVDSSSSRALVMRLAAPWTVE